MLRVTQDGLVFGALVVACAVICLSVSALVGAMAYAGVWEDDRRSESACECC